MRTVPRVFHRQPTEFTMIPILAAASAISMIDKIADTAASSWKHLTATSHTDNKTNETASAGSFAAALAAQIAKK
jgi:hypothetical protein